MQNHNVPRSWAHGHGPRSHVGEIWKRRSWHQDLWEHEGKSVNFMIPAPKAEDAHVS
jgi:hypothetical protein